MTLQTLIAFAGLPGAGKSTIARALSARTGAVYLRVDEIENVMLAHEPDKDIGSQSYEMLTALAVSNLTLGHTVITDCVNPWAITREMFAAAAARSDADFVGIEITCSDPDMHRRRVEGRPIDIPGWKLPSWQDVLDRDYHPWKAADILIDTAGTSVDQAVSKIISGL